MASLHISKVAVGCASIDALRSRQEARRAGGCVPIITRFRPKRADELIGGSLYWIVKHQLCVRQQILGFEDAADDARTIIRLDPALVAVRVQARRAHQGWRYLASADAPPDADGEDDGLAALPPRLMARLTSLALL